MFNGEEGQKLLEALLSQGMGTDDDSNAEAIIKAKKMASYKTPTKEEQLKIREAIKNAKSLAEIARLEQALAGGVFHIQ